MLVQVKKLEELKKLGKFYDDGDGKFEIDFGHEVYINDIEEILPEDRMIEVSYCSKDNLYIWEDKEGYEWYFVKISLDF